MFWGLKFLWPMMFMCLGCLAALDVSDLGCVGPWMFRRLKGDGMGRRVVFNQGKG